MNNPMEDLEQMLFENRKSLNKILTEVFSKYLGRAMTMLDIVQRGKIDKVINPETGEILEEFSMDDVLLVRNKIIFVDGGIKAEVTHAQIKAVQQVDIPVPIERPSGTLVH